MKILWIDTETGGYNAEKNSLLTVALAVYEDKRVLTVKEWKVKSKEYIVTSSALNTNKINLVDHDAQAQEREEVVKEIIEFIKLNFGEEKPYVGGQYVEFDIKFMVKLFKDCNEGWNKYVSYRTIDTCQLLRFLYAAGKIDKDVAALDKAIEYFNITVDGRHCATGDILATIKVFDYISDMIHINSKGE